jgi:hypothetical protein
MAAPQYLHGDSAPIQVTIATAKAVDAGDIVGLSSNTLVRAEDQAWDTDLATTQTAFALLFTGVSMQTKTSTTVARIFGNSEDNVCMVATAGEYEFDCASATFEVGDYVGPAKDTGNALLSDKVVEVASEALAIGRVVKRGTSITRVRIRLLSKLSPLARQA